MVDSGEGMGKNPTEVYHGANKQTKKLHLAFCLPSFVDGVTTGNYI